MHVPDKFLYVLKYIKRVHLIFLAFEGYLHTNLSLVFKTKMQNYFASRAHFDMFFVYYISNAHFEFFIESFECILKLLFSYFSVNECSEYLYEGSRT